MPRLTSSVRIAASSILLLSIVHIILWAIFAIVLLTEATGGFPYEIYFPVAVIFSVCGFFGIVVAIGIFRANNWARIAALVLAALVALFCALALVASLAVILGGSSTALGVELPASSKSDLARVAAVYFLIFSLSIWWIILFSRKSVAAQFSGIASVCAPTTPAKPACPPPIALLAWLMIISAVLSVLSWPLILGRIPVMLFNHIFSLQPSKWIWIVNIVLFLGCGMGLLKLQRWSYSATIAIHAFWLVSLFVSQLSALYERYLSVCLTAFQTPETFYVLHFHTPQWISATLTAIPTTLLIAGLFYYRRAFLRAVADSRH